MAAKQTTSTSTDAPVKVARKQISTTVPEDLYNAIEDLRWGQRMKTSEVVEAALSEWVEIHK